MLTACTELNNSLSRQLVNTCITQRPSSITMLLPLQTDSGR